MIQSISKIALVAAVAALAVATTSSSSMARGKKMMAACAPVWSVKTNACANGMCTMLRCHTDGKWYPSMAMCWQPWCPK